MISSIVIAETPTTAFAAHRSETPLSVVFVRLYAHLYSIRSIIVCSILCLASAWILSSCNDAPGPVGSELVPTDSISLRIVSNDSLPLISATSLGQVTPKMATELARTSARTPYFVGAAITPDAERFTATAFMRFQLPVRNDSIRQADYAGLTANDIIEARLFLRPAACLLGDTIGKIAPFNIYEVRQRWYDDSIVVAQNVPEASSFAAQTPLAVYSQQFADSSFDAGDVLSRKRSFVLRDKALIARWINADTTQWRSNIFGIALVPSNAATAMFRFDESASIFVRFKRPQDTLERSITILEDAQITVGRTTTPSNPAANEIIVQGGTALRTALAFDTRLIPMLSTIHQAELILPIDTVRSLVGTCGLPSSVQLSFSDPARPTSIDTTVRITATGFLNTTTGTARYIFSSGTNTTPNMLGIIQQLTKVGGRANVLLHLTPQFFDGANRVFIRSDEEQMFNRLVFRRLRGSTDPAFRPRLSITYSVRPR
ncbi:MAG: hypothetical protein EAZ92_04230 [Candidatus Kapaibacterium sp.]|nr:MAG: hypothetical protein EAZ92_04230 [Candidatus Kapabacteria bacterium]